MRRGAGSEPDPPVVEGRHPPSGAGGRQRTPPPRMVRGLPVLRSKQTTAVRGTLPGFRGLPAPDSRWAIDQVDDGSKLPGGDAQRGGSHWRQDSGSSESPVSRPEGASLALAGTQASGGWVRLLDSSPYISDPVCKDVTKRAAPTPRVTKTLCPPWPLRSRRELSSLALAYVGGSTVPG
jgi:hypothetical protein